jgi:acetyltransferase-like isoleucine patch superfamily enzyme
MRARRFIRVNGLYLFSGELGRRAGIAFRRRMLGGKLGCPDVVIGPRCYLRGLACIRIGKNFQAAEGLWLEAVTAHPGQIFSPSIVIGNDVSISRWSHIAATNRIEIGDGVLIGSKVLITDHNHGHYREGARDLGIAPALRPLDKDKQVLIGKNVWIGDGVVVTPGATIGDGAVIGANSVVTGAIPPYTVAAGVPARCLRTWDSGSTIS